MNQKATDTLFALEKTLVLKHYGQSTIDNYKKMFSIFLMKFMHQNQLINSIKAYYEHVLGLPREYYDIQRPKKSKNIPNVLNLKEVLNIIQHPKNISSPLDYLLKN